MSITPTNRRIISLIVLVIIFAVSFALYKLGQPKVIKNPVTFDLVKEAESNGVSDAYLVISSSDLTRDRMVTLRDQLNQKFSTVSVGNGFVYTDKACAELSYKASHMPDGSFTPEDNKAVYKCMDDRSFVARYQKNIKPGGKSYMDVYYDGFEGTNHERIW